MPATSATWTRGVMCRGFGFGIMLLAACGGPAADVNVLGQHQCLGELKLDVDDLDGDGSTNECIDKGCNKGAPSCGTYDVEDANFNGVTCECR